jgi:hypothetical protein
MGPDYYKHSGKFAPGGLLAGLVGGILAGAILAAAYAYLELYIPLAGVITFILTAGFGGLLGLVLGALMKWGKVRSAPATMLVSLIVAAVSFYISWGVWLYAALRRADVEQADVLAILLNPGAMWELAGEINKVGAWTIRSWTPTGGILWGFWGLEALIIFAMTLLLAKVVIEGDPFCEHCGKWCEEAKGVLRVPMADPDEMKQRMEMKDFSYLEKLAAGKMDPSASMSLDVHTCPNCRNTNTLTVKSTTVTADNKGKESKEEKEILDKLVLTPSDAETIRSLGQKFALSPAPEIAK